MMQGVFMGLWTRLFKSAAMQPVAVAADEEAVRSAGKAADDTGGARRATTEPPETRMRAIPTETDVEPPRTPTVHSRAAGGIRPTASEDAARALRAQSEA